MTNTIIVKEKIKNFNKKIFIPGDKSLSIRWILFSSIASGTSEAKNLLMSEDVLSAIDAIRKLGIKVNIKKNNCKIYGEGIDGYKYKKNLIINARNSGTLGRLILGLFVNSTYPIKLIGDKSLSKRDFKRIAEPLTKFGANFNLNRNKNLPLTIYGSKNLKSITYNENRGSAQCKSSVIFAAMRAEGETSIKARKSRNHTELLCRYLKLPIKIVSKKKYDFIKIRKIKKIEPLNYKIPSDMSSAAFFIVLAALTDNSKLRIKNININPTRIGVIKILKKMGVSISLINKKKYKGELISDIVVKSSKNLKAINCPPKFNSGAIDEFLLIFLIAAKAKGTSYFKDLAELNEKESPRLKWGAKILKNMCIKVKLTKDSIKIHGNPELNINKKIEIKNFLKDHRVFMTSVVAAYCFGGNWKIHNKDSIRSSFPSFLKIIDLINESKKKIKNSY